MATCPICRTWYPSDATICEKDGESLLPDQAFAGADIDLAPGASVGEYRIDAKLGSGGFGTVYRATHPIIGKAAAIKVLGGQFSANPQMVSRFIAEARAVNQIRHRNIVDIFSFGMLDDGRHYYVMELLEGEPLDLYVAERGRLSIEDAIPILRGIARALDAAHAAGLAHRDLKPENVFIVHEDDGVVRPKLLDFGIAKLLTETSGGHKTKTGAPMGTPAYMSPEQCRGLHVDARTDVYSFGVLCHKLLTGRTLFEAESVMDILFMHAHAPPPRLSEHCAALPSDLDGAVLAMLAKDPAARPAAAGAALEALATAAAVAGFAVIRAPAASGPSLYRTRAAAGANDPTLPLGGHAAEPLARDAAARELELARTLARTAPGARTLTPTETTVVPRPRRTLVMATSGALALALAGVMVAVVGRTPPTAREASARVPYADVSGASPGPAAPSLDAAQQAVHLVPSSGDGAPIVAPAPSDEVAVTVKTVPARAEVYAGSRRLGDSPGPFRLPRGHSKVALTVRAPGYQPTTIDIVPSASVTASASLSRAPRDAKRPATSRDLENPF